MDMKQVRTLHIFLILNGLGQAYILSLKNGDNSIIIVGGSNAAYDPNMNELDEKWTQAIKSSNGLPF
jgi:hypothetical protein